MKISMTAIAVVLLVGATNIGEAIEVMEREVVLAAYNLKGITASGEKVNSKTAAFHPDFIKENNLQWGDMIYIPGSDIRLLQDKMKPTKVNRFRLDLWYKKDYHACRKIGIRRAKIIIFSLRPFLKTLYSKRYINVGSVKGAL